MNSSENKRILIDLDESTKPFVNPFLKIYNKEFGESVKVSDIMEYDMCKFLKHLPTRESFWDYVKLHAKELYYDIKPYKQVSETIQYIKDKGFDPVVITAAPNEAKEHIFKWIGKYKIFCSIIFDHHKENYNGLMIVDDCPKYLENNNAMYSVKVNRLYNKETDSDLNINKFHHLTDLIDWYVWYNK
jgi:uncharacterized HAD superfamily protein